MDKNIHSIQDTAKKNSFSDFVMKCGSTNRNSTTETSTSRMSGTFPLMTELFRQTPFKNIPSLTPRNSMLKPFDETILNINDSLIKRKKRKSSDDSDLKDSANANAVLASPWEIQRIKTELTTAKTEIKNLELILSQAHRTRKEMEVMFEQEKFSQLSTIDKYKSNVYELEKRVKSLKKREEYLKEEMMEKNTILMNKNLELTKQLEKTSEDLQKELEKNVNSAELEVKLKLEASDNKGKNDILLKELDETKIQLAYVQAQLVASKGENKANEITITELDAAKKKIIELEVELNTRNEEALLVRSQQAKLLKYSELEMQVNKLLQDNQKLKETQGQVIYLEGIIDALKIKLSNLEKSETELGNVKCELMSLKTEVADWRSISNDVLNDTKLSLTPYRLREYLRELQAARLLAHSEKVQLQLNLDRINRESEEEIKKLNDELITLKNDNSRLTESTKVLKKQHALVTWERNDLRKVLDSYQRDVSFSADPRIEALESLIEGYRKRFEELEKDSNLMNNVSSIKVKCDEKEELLARINELENELKHRPEQDDFNPADTKILHCKMNPNDIALKERQDMMETLKKENIILKEKIRLLREDNVSNLTLLAVDSVPAAKQIEELTEKVKSQELQNQRLREAFKAKTQEYREAVYLLFGYQVAGSRDKTFRLNHIYANSSDESLLFKMTQQKTLELLESPMLSEFSNLIDELSNHNSIPVFLSRLTIKLFERFNESMISQ